MVAWASGVNQRILRSSEWGDTEGFLEDTSLCGKNRRRGSHYMARRVFSVKMRFRYSEFALFRTWYMTVCRYGVYSFAFPKIDADSGTGEYRFAKGGSPKYKNISGDLVDVQMTWEEV